MTKLSYANIFDAITGDRAEAARLQRRADAYIAARELPEGAMRVAPGSDAVVWRINPDKCGEL